MYVMGYQCARPRDWIVCKPFFSADKNFFLANIWQGFAINYAYLFFTFCNKHTCDFLMTKFLNKGTAIRKLQVNQAGQGLFTWEESCY